MTYKLKFVLPAKKEWGKLAPPIQQQFKKKLAERLETPHNVSAQLRNFQSVYKIKLKASGYRLAYEVIDDENAVYVLAVGQRNHNAIYLKLAERFKKSKAIASVTRKRKPSP